MGLSIDEMRTLLGVSSAASEEEIKLAYKVKAKEWHPDLYFGRKEEEALAHENFRNITKAYKHLLHVEECRRLGISPEPSVIRYWSPARNTGMPVKKTLLLSSALLAGGCLVFAFGYWIYRQVPSMYDPYTRFEKQSAKFATKPNPQREAIIAAAMEGNTAKKE